MNAPFQLARIIFARNPPEPKQFDEKAAWEKIQDSDPCVFRALQDIYLVSTGVEPRACEHELGIAYRLQLTEEAAREQTPNSFTWQRNPMQAIKTKKGWLVNGTRGVPLPDRIASNALIRQADGLRYISATVKDGICGAFIKVEPREIPAEPSQRLRIIGDNVVFMNAGSRSPR